MDKKPRLLFLDCLRGLAIVAVVATHSTQVAGEPAWLTGVASWGARGVQLFFAVSAYTLLSVDQGEPYGRFLIRRFFRIAPMFYLAIIFYLWLFGMGPRYFAPSGITPIDVAATFAFMHDWLPNAADAVVPGCFTIGVEASFYLIFPLLARHVNSLSRSLILLGIGLLISVALYVVVPRVLAGSPAQLRSFSYFLFPAQLPAFAVGFAAFHAVRKWRGKALAIRLARPAIVAILAVIVVLALIHTQWSRLHLFGDLLLGALLCAVALAPPPWLVNPVMGFIGRVSYSVYIIHFAVIEAVRPLARASPWGALAAYPLVLGVSVGLASLTWRHIETPMIALGRRLSRKIPAAEPQAA